MKATHGHAAPGPAQLPSVEAVTAVGGGGGLCSVEAVCGHWGRELSQGPARGAAQHPVGHRVVAKPSSPDFRQPEAGGGTEEGLCEALGASWAGHSCPHSAGGMVGHQHLSPPTSLWENRVDLVLILS